MGRGAETYRHHLETLSLTLHPFSISDAAPQTSVQVQADCKRQWRPSQPWLNTISCRPGTMP